MNSPPPIALYLSPPYLTDADHTSVAAALQSGWVAPLGPEVDGFENDLSRHHEGRPVAALASGTAALHLALILAGVQRGDPVLCQSFTFAATANAIDYCGGVPIFIDSEAESWNLDPTLIDDAVSLALSTTGRAPRVGIFVDLYGVPANIAALTAAAKRHGIIWIEDAAEALGSTFSGRPMGVFGTFGICSFNGNKIITTSGGGALVTSTPEEAAQARFLATQARDPAPHYQHSVIGFNYRLSNILAALGRTQLASLPMRIARRAHHYARYRAALAPQLSFLSPLPGASWNYWLSTALTPSEAVRDRILNSLRSRGIEARPLWKPLHLQPVFAHAPKVSRGISDDLFSRGLCLPSGTGMTEAEQDEVIAITREALDRRLQPAASLASYAARRMQE